MAVCFGVKMRPSTGPARAGGVPPRPAGAIRAPDPGLGHRAHALRTGRQPQAPDPPGWAGRACPCRSPSGRRRPWGATAAHLSASTRVTPPEASPGRRRPPHPGRRSTAHHWRRRTARWAPQQPLPDAVVFSHTRYRSCSLGPRSQAPRASGCASRGSGRSPAQVLSGRVRTRSIGGSTERERECVCVCVCLCDGPRTHGVRRRTPSAGTKFQDL